MPSLRPALLLLAAVLSAAPLEAEWVKRLDIVDRSIAEHGGDRFFSATTRLDICSRSGCFNVAMRLEGGLFDYTITQDDQGRRVRLTNSTVERWQDGSPVGTGEDEERWRSFVSQRVYFVSLPFRLGDSSVFLEDHGIVDWEGRRLHEVKVSFEPGSSAGSASEYLYWFDPSSARLEQFAYDYEDGMRFRRAVNHRRVDGILFFDQENLGLEGEGLSVDLIDPVYVAETMRPISTVEIRNITVRPLAAD